tara:strand:- start:1108 stop:2535 length:1428 start_codon:yes stop_codon:yes gene_type:complete
MLKFVDLNRETPEKVNSQVRKDNFLEIYKEFIDTKAKEQASRCSQCGTPFCQVHCPLQNNIPDWLKLTAEGRLKDAYEVSAATNSLPEVCGSICPQDRLCEGNCVIEQSGHGTVTIGAVEKFITNTAWDNGWIKPIVPLTELKESVGIIGSGPAGIAAAMELRKEGYQVTIYDRYDRAGGLLIYGIPNFKLEKSTVLRRIKLLEDSKIKIIKNFEVGKNSSFKELKEKHDAVLIATGVYKARQINTPGSELKNIYPAMHFLTASNKKGLGDKVEEFENGSLNAEGKNVVVVGGGDTAMDCVRTAVRQKAKSVSCLYRRDKVNMPGSAREVMNAEEEGVKFVWLSTPKVFEGNKKVEKVIINKMRLGEADSSGRQTPKAIEGSEEILKADLVIEALGFEPEEIPKLFNEPKLEITRWGTIKVDLKTLKTNIKGVFAAGDIVRGASLVVWAIRDGKDAAKGISQYLNKINQKKIRAA